MATYTISPLAYLKVLLHSAKFPTSTVTGLLVGTSQNDTIVVDDAIPLLHHWTELSPMMEAGLQMVRLLPQRLSYEYSLRTLISFLLPSVQAEIYAKTQGKVFVGLYVANELVDDTRVPFTTLKVAGAMKKDFPQTIILVVDNSKLGSPLPALIPHLPSSKSDNWTASTLPSQFVSLSDPTIPTTALEQIRQGKHKLLGDFDEHLEDVTVDWLKNARVSI